MHSFNRQAKGSSETRQAPVTPVKVPWCDTLKLTARIRPLGSTQWHGAWVAFYYSWLSTPLSDGDFCSPSSLVISCLPLTAPLFLSLPFPSAPFSALSNLPYWLPFFPPWFSLFFLFFLSHFFLSQHPHPSRNVIFQYLPDGFSCSIMFSLVLVVLGTRLRKRFLYIFHRWCVWNIFPSNPLSSLLPILLSPKQWHF